MSRLISIVYNGGEPVDYDGEPDGLFSGIRHQIHPVFTGEDDDRVITEDGAIYLDYFGDRTEEERPTVVMPTKPAQYRTLVTPEEFIGLFSNDQWGDCVTSEDPDAAKFVTQLQNYKKPFEVTHQRVIDGMTSIATASDIGMTGPEAQQIVKGVPL